MDAAIAAGDVLQQQDSDGRVYCSFNTFTQRQTTTIAEDFQISNTRTGINESVYQGLSDTFGSVSLGSSFVPLDNSGGSSTTTLALCGPAGSAHHAGLAGATGGALHAGLGGVAGGAPHAGLGGVAGGAHHAGLGGVATHGHALGGTAGLAGATGGAHPAGLAGAPGGAHHAGLAGATGGLAGLAATGLAGATGGAHHAGLALAGGAGNCTLGGAHHAGLAGATGGLAGLATNGLGGATIGATTHRPQQFVIPQKYSSEMRGLCKLANTKVTTGGALLNRVRLTLPDKHQVLKQALGDMTTTKNQVEHILQYTEGLAGEALTVDYLENALKIFARKCLDVDEIVSGLKIHARNIGIQL